jgi:hypothetical protein
MDVKDAAKYLDNGRKGFLEHYQHVNLRNELSDHQRLVLVIGYLCLS